MQGLIRSITIKSKNIKEEDDTFTQIVKQLEIQLSGPEDVIIK
jgi:hypothetical protein